MPYESTARAQYVNPLLFCLCSGKKTVCFIQLNKYYFRFICDDSCASSQGTLTKRNSVQYIRWCARLYPCLCSLVVHFLLLVVCVIVTPRYTIYGTQRSVYTFVRAFMWNDWRAYTYTFNTTQTHISITPSLTVFLQKINDWLGVSSLACVWVCVVRSVIHFIVYNM